MSVVSTGSGSGSAIAASALYAGGQGMGGTNTKIRYFTGLVGSDTGTAYWTINNSSDLGFSVTLSASGLYYFSYSDLFNAASVHGFSINASGAELTTNITSLPNTVAIMMTNTTADDIVLNVSMLRHFVAGTVIRPHTQGDSNGVSTDRVRFLVSKVT